MTSKLIKFKSTGIIIIDNFLSEETCNNLRNFALNPTFGYHDIYNGYTAVNFDRFTGDLSQIDVVNEFKDKIKFLENIKYIRSWCFCYNNKSRGVLPHADPSYININVWVTPNECINNPDKNGLKIYHKIRDKNTPHSAYNRDIDYINNEILNSKYTVIPYKYQRATIFLGSMYHETMGVDMKDGKDNKRVSYTYLFDKI
jgi:hypothetical protein